MYKIGDVWINPETLLFVRDDPQKNKITLFFPGPWIQEFEGEDRQKMLYVLEKEATEIR